MRRGPEGAILAGSRRTIDDARGEKAMPARGSPGAATNTHGEANDAIEQWSRRGDGRRTGRPLARHAPDRTRACALRGAVRGAYARYEKLGDARDDGAHRAPRRDLARRGTARHHHVRP